MLAHGGAVVRIGLISGVGMIATFAFQILTARALGPEDFGALSAFFSIVSMAAIGSASLQNAVAVQTARDQGEAPVVRRRIDGFTIEALVLGGLGAMIVAAGSPLIAAALDAPISVPLAAAASILLSFLFSRALGTIQGVGRSEAAIAWSTFSLVIRVGLIAGVFTLGWGLPGAIAAVLVGSLVATAGALLSAIRRHAPVEHSPFRADGIVVILLNVVFAVLINVDVLLIRATAEGTVSGVYAAAGSLVKSGFLIPSTLSLYLLPRMVRQRENRSLTRLGVKATIALSALGAAAMLVIFAVAGEPIMHLVFGEAFAVDGILLVGITAAYAPWIIAQGLLIRVTAVVSRSALAVLCSAAVLTVLLGLLVLPSLGAFLIMFGAVGIAVLTVFLVIDTHHDRRAQRLE